MLNARFRHARRPAGRTPDGRASPARPVPLRAAGDLSERLIRSPVGALAHGPWLDPVVLFALRRWFFPLSRLWAAGSIAQGSVPHFADTLGKRDFGPRGARFVARLLAHVDRVQADAAHREAAWQAAFFGAEADRLGMAARAERERLRRLAAHRWMMLRGAFYPLLYGTPTPLVRWQVPAVDEVDAIWGGCIGQPERLYALPDPLPAIGESPAIDGPNGREWWLRFPSPSPRMGDLAYAKVLEPPGTAPGTPTVIIANGVCMEPEMVRGMVDASAVMARLGFRVVEMTTPWHGRRCPRGWYGGERFFAAPPVSVIDLFTAGTLESAVLIDWCRRRFDGPVAMGGISLGSFVAQLVAAHARNWPARLTPDALLLVTHNGRMEEVTFDGGLVDSIGLTEAMAAAGWTRAQMLRLAPLMDPPPGPPAVPAERIVSVLGTADRVTLFGGGRDLARHWRIPEENLFVMNQGHFGMPLKLIRDPAPLLRLRAIVGQG